MTNSGLGRRGHRPPEELAELPEGIERWYIEKNSPFSGHFYGVVETIFEGKSLFQDIEILRIAHFGKTLFLDKKMQSAETSEWIYHELLVHPVMVAHEKPERILIIGGGEGATAREVFKHPTVKAVDMVEIDIMVYEVCKQYMPEMNAGAFDDPRFSLIIGDGRKFVEALSGRPTYDVVIVDATDPLAGTPSYLLYTKEFYELVRSVLKPGGLMVSQAEMVCTSDLGIAALSIYKTVKSVFPIARYYSDWVPSFYSEWGFVVGSEDVDPAALSAEEVEARLRGRGISGLKHYTPRRHEIIFRMPKYFEEAVEKHPRARVVYDSGPLFVFSEPKKPWVPGAEGLGEQASDG